METHKISPRIFVIYFSRTTVHFCNRFYYPDNLFLGKTTCSQSLSTNHSNSRQTLLSFSNRKLLIHCLLNFVV
jgi:hypothetical protein